MGKIMTLPVNENWSSVKDRSVKEQNKMAFEKTIVREYIIVASSGPSAILTLQQAVWNS